MDFLEPIPMSHPTFPLLVSWTLAALFGAGGVLHIVGLRDLYARWRYPRNFHRVTGTLMLLSAAFLAIGETRIWGVALGALVTFTATVTLLNHRQYLFAAWGMVVLAALAPATLAALS
jgi:hypothetical protein